MNDEVPISKPAVSGFSGLGIEEKILGVLAKLQFHTPTPIQHKAIPVGLEGKDIIGIAQTGTGKTLAFAIPIIQRLPKLKGKAVIILPTRELALQVDETFKKVGRDFGVRTVVLIGGMHMGQQIRDLRGTARVIIGTPGRIIDHLQRRTVSLHDVEMLVLDEADRMLDMGFAPQIKKILAVVPKERQTLLFSATMPADIVKIATTHMKLPVRVEIARPGTTVERVEQEVFIVRPNQKNRLLEALLVKFQGSVLVFSRTKFGAKRICAAVKHMGYTAAEIHSNRSLAQRKEALLGFKNGKYRILVATDIASRGIDVVGIELVINYDIPEDAEDYVHRIGRTARAGKTGHAVTFAMQDQTHKIRHIERLIRTVLKISQLPELPPDRTPLPFDHPSSTRESPRPSHRGAPHHRGSSSYRGGSPSGGSHGSSHRGGQSSSGHSSGGGRPGSGGRSRFGRGGHQKRSGSF